MIHMISLEKEM